jgi:ribosomal protein S13
MKVYSLLCALPGVGPKKAARLCRTAGIDLDRKVQGCGVHQRDKLFILLAKL